MASEKNNFGQKFVGERRIFGKKNFALQITCGRYLADKFRGG